MRADRSTATLLSAVHDVVRAIDADQPVAEAATLHDILERSVPVARRRFQLQILVAIGAFAALLAALGVYGVVAQAVVQRTGEIGVRVALGATSRDIARLVLAGAARLIVVGVPLGLVGAAAFGQVLSSTLYGVRPGDPLALSLAAAVLVTAAIAACALPAHRAARQDPVAALRRGS